MFCARVFSFSERKAGEVCDSEVYTDHNGDKWVLRCFPRGTLASGNDAGVEFILTMLPHDEDISATAKARVAFIDKAKAVFVNQLPVDLILLIAGYACDDFVYGGAGPASRSVQVQIGNSRFRANPFQISAIHTLHEPLVGRLCAVSEVEVADSGYLRNDTLEINVTIDPEGKGRQLSSFDNWLINTTLTLMKTTLLRPFEVLKLLGQHPVIPGLGVKDVCFQHPEVLLAGHSTSSFRCLAGRVVDHLRMTTFSSPLLSSGILSLLAVYPFDGWCTVSPFQLLSPSQTFPSTLVPHGLPMAVLGIFLNRFLFLRLVNTGRLCLPRNRQGSLIWTRACGYLAALLGYPLNTVKCHQQLVGCSAVVSFRAIYAQGGLASFFRGVGFFLIGRLVFTSLLDRLNVLSPVFKELKEASVRKRRRKCHPMVFYVLLGTLSASCFAVPALLSWGLTARVKRLVVARGL